MDSWDPRPSYVPGYWRPWWVNRWVAASPTRILRYWWGALATSVVLIAFGAWLWMPLLAGGIAGVAPAFELLRYGPRARAGRRVQLNGS
jgi:hypothetical protein